MALTHVQRTGLVAAAALVAGLLALAAATGGDGAAAATVRFEVPADHPERWFVELTGGGAGEGALTVYALPPGVAASDELPPLIGRYESIGARVRFVPQFAPVAGVTYVARADGAAEARFALPARPAASQTRVIAIYPTIGRVPANLLKLYVEFSAPMRDGDAEQRLHLLDLGGRELPRAFLHVDAELWNETHTRLTVLFDPGRVKRGLRANLEDGAPLAAGDTFRLVVDAAWRDAYGAPLVAGFEKTLSVGPADRTSPDWRRWTVTAPAPGTREAVTVRFDEPLDRALLDRWLAVTDAAGAPLTGQASAGSNQTSWSFVPADAWRDGRYQLRIDPRLEDLAGNSLTALFDADMTQGQRDDRRTTIVLPFSVTNGRGRAPTD